MKSWQRMAIELLPELQKEALAAENPMQLWNELAFDFDEAYEMPTNEDFIKRVYAYADWCLEQPDEEGVSAENHLPSCVAICFWEHIPTCQAARQDMPRWFSFDDLMANREFFQYLITNEEFEEIIGLYGQRPEALVNN